MATQTLETADAGLVVSGGAATYPAVGTWETAGPLHTETTQVLYPPIYNDPVSPAPSPGTPSYNPTVPAPSAPSLPIDNCDSCKPAAPGPGNVGLVPIPTPAPVLKTEAAAGGCEICAKLRALPWWVWLLIGATFVYLWTRR